MRYLLLLCVVLLGSCAGESYSGAIVPVPIDNPTPFPVICSTSQGDVLAEPGRTLALFVPENGRVDFTIDCEGTQVSGSMTHKPSELILDPTAYGYTSTLAMDYDMLMSALVDERTNIVSLHNGFLDVPWYERSDTADQLKAWGTVLGPTPDRHVMVTDEFTEACLLIAAWNRSDLMEGCANTLEAAEGEHGLPGWTILYDRGSIQVLSPDSATDASTRAIFALFVAAHNEAFSREDRSRYQDLARDYLQAHLEAEYVDRQYLSTYRNEIEDYVLVGGGTTEDQMWIGYYTDVLFALSAAYADDPKSEYVDRIDLVLEQALMALNTTGEASAGPEQFRWKKRGAQLVVEPIYPRFGRDVPTWGDSDGPRILQLGAALRAIRLSEAPVDQRLMSAATEYTSNMPQGCVQYSWSGEGRGYCGSDFYVDSLNAMLVMESDPQRSGELVLQAMSDVDWETGIPSGYEVSGVFRPSKLIKSVGLATGLFDAAVTP